MYSICFRVFLKPDTARTNPSKMPIRTTHRPSWYFPHSHIAKPVIPAKGKTTLSPSCVSQISMLQSLIHSSILQSSISIHTSKYIHLHYIIVNFNSQSTFSLCNLSEFISNRFSSNKKIDFVKFATMQNACRSFYKPYVVYVKIWLIILWQYSALMRWFPLIDS